MPIDPNPYPTGYGPQSAMQGSPDFLKQGDFSSGAGAVANMVKALMSGYGNYLKQKPGSPPPAGAVPGAPLNIQPPAQSWPPPGTAPVPFAGMGGGSGGMGFMGMLKNSGMGGGFMDLLKSKQQPQMPPPDMNPTASTNPVANALFSPVPMSSQNAIY